MSQISDAKIIGWIESLSGGFMQVRAWVGRWRLPFILLGIVLLLGGGYWSIRTSGIDFHDLHLGPTLLVFLMFPLLSILHGLVGLKLLARTAGVSIEFWHAFRVTATAEVAQVFPLPGGAVVRAAALFKAGVGGALSAGLVFLSTILWISLALSGMGGALLVTGQMIGSVPLIVGVVVSVSALGWVCRKASMMIAAAILFHRIIGLLINIARLVTAFAALGSAVLPTTATIIALAGIAGSAINVLPAGLGLSEAIAALFATFTEVDPSVAFLAVAFQRIVGLAGFGLFALSTVAISPRKTMAV